MGKGSRKTHQGAKEARARKPSGDTADASAAGKNSDSKLWLALVLLIGVVLSVVHTMHISTLFENDRHFSHLADFEREMVYRTEMGLYYSYYKTLITAPTLYVGLHEITHDNVTEYGHTINTLKRFNLYPEVILGAAYRLFKRVVALTKWKAETCWRVNRGDNLPPVESCEGIGNQHYFYVWNVFALFGTVAAVVFFISIIVGGSVFGGLIAACCFFFNHGEATRVQWTPPLRESFGYPVFILQILVVTYILRNNRSGLMWTFSVAALTTTFMLFWQFAAFALSTQVGSLFGTFILDFVPTSTIATIVRGHAIGFGIAYILLFGNEMLLTSLFLSSVITFLLILGLDGTLNRIRFRPLYLLVNSVVFIGGTLGIKVAIGRAVHINDDEHIFDILRSKFTNFANFHTRLYTCAREFDFLGVDFLTPVSLTLLLPAAVVTAQLLCTYMARFELPFCLTRNGSRNKQYAEIVYNAIQCVCFAIMAGMIMRLKLFFTPHLCIMAAVLANTKFVSQAIGRRISIGLHRFILVALVAVMAVKGVQNIQKQRGIQGEYSNPEQEKLFEWIVKNTRSDAVFAGTMPVMANVKLSTNRPIVNHPHYEDAMLRARTLKVYSMYSKKPLSEVHAALKDMRVEYFVYQPELCIPHPTKPECSYRSIWDLEDPKNIDRESLCDVYERAFMTRNFTILNPFKLVYSARAYAVFKL